MSDIPPRSRRRSDVNFTIDRISQARGSTIFYIVHNHSLSRMETAGSNVLGAGQLAGASH